MRNKKITLLLLTTICAAAPYLYGTCVGEKDCYHGFGFQGILDQSCQSSLPEKTRASEEHPAYWEAGDSPCGEVYRSFGFQNTHVPCGAATIETECL